jgi:hypothetical protein
MPFAINQHPEKATSPAGMAGDTADLPDLQQYDIGVTIDTYFLDFLFMTRFFTLKP